MCEGGRQPFPWRQPVHGARWRISRGCPTTASSPCWCGSSSAAPLSPSWSIKRLLLQSPACCVDRVTKETIARHLASNHPGHHRPSVDPDPGFSKHPDMLCGRTIPFDTIAIAGKKSTRRLFTSRATSPRACKDKEVKPWSQTRTHGHLWGTTKMQDPARRSKAMVAISAACLFPFFTGKPEATM